MSGTLITQFSSSNSNLHVNYFDPVINQNANFVGLDVRKPGIYSGGYLTPVGNTTFSLTNFACEIQDSGGSGNQIRLVTTGTPVTISVSNTSPATMVVVRWTYATSSVANYPSIYTVEQGFQNSTDLIIGTAAYSGSVLSADYGALYPTYMRSDPANILDLCLKPEAVASLPYAMTSGVIVRTGKINYGVSTSIVPTQVATVSASLSTGYYQVVLLQVSTTGVLSTSLSPYGTPTTSPTPTAPAYGNYITLAEITVYNNSGSYTITNIKDVRCFTNSGVLPGNLLPSQTGYGGDFLYTNGTVASWQPITIDGLLPSQSGKGGDYLYTNGSNASWQPITIDGLLPSQSGKGGDYLYTNGSNASWQAITIDGLLPSQSSNAGKALITNGANASWGYSNAYYAS